MATEYIGACIAELDGKEASVTSVDTTVTGGFKKVLLMGKAGVVRVNKGYDISLKAVTAINGSSPNWEALQGGKFTLSPVESNIRISFLDCYFQEQNESYTVDNEAVYDVKIFAMKKIVE